jgi:hypothetical protein
MIGLPEKIGARWTLAGKLIASLPGGATVSYVMSLESSPPRRPNKGAWLFEQFFKKP